MMKIILSILLVLTSFSSALAQSDSAEILEKYTKEQLFAPIEGDVIIGDKNAPVTIIEYASMSCGHCASFHNKTFNDLKEKYIDSGKARFIFRDFPLDEPALRGAMMARCAGEKDEGDFLKFNKAVFSTQSNWAPKKNYLEILSNIGKLGGMTGADFELCIADKNLERYVMENKFYASKILGVNSTPTFFVNGKMHKGAKNLAYFSGVIDKITGEDQKTSE